MKKGDMLKVFDLLTEPKTIPQICRETNLDQYAVMVILSKLEDEGKVVLSGFDRFYEPDGYPGYLAKYGRTAHD